MQDPRAVASDNLEVSYPNATVSDAMFGDAYTYLELSHRASAAGSQGRWYATRRYHLHSFTIDPRNRAVGRTQADR